MTTKWNKRYLLGNYVRTIDNAHCFYDKQQITLKEGDTEVDTNIRS